MEIIEKLIQEIEEKQRLHEKISQLEEKISVLEKMFEDEL